MKSKIVIGALLGLLGVGAACLGVAVERPPEQRRAAAQKAFNAGNFNDAYKLYASLATGDADYPFNTPQDFDLAVQSLQRLARWDEVDDFREMLQHSLYGDGAWRLQYLTDLSTLPDYEDGNLYYYGGQTRGAPMDENGNAVFHSVPKSWAEAKSDGQRWRWCLVQAAEVSPAHSGQARYTLAEFLRQQFDVQTMAQFGYRFGFNDFDDDRVGGRPAQQGENHNAADKSGPFAVSTLGEDETIARLASGIKRFKLPDEFNFVKLFQSLAESNDPWAQNALQSLAQIFA